VVVEKPVRRWRKGAIALVVFTLVSLGIGPKVVDRYFDDALDSIVVQLGSVAVRVAPLPVKADSLLLQAWAFGEVSALGAAPLQVSHAEAAILDRGVPVGGFSTQFIVESNRANDLVVTEMRTRS
jgi:hypothetical protein